MKRGIRPVLLLVLLLLAWLGDAAAAECSAHLKGLDFGRLAASDGSPADAIGAVEVLCHGTPGEAVAYRISLMQGSGDFAQRRMDGAPHALHYNLYTDPAHTVVWGDGSASTVVVADSYILPAQSQVRDYPVFGRVHVQPQASAGHYRDSLAIVLDY